MEIQLTHRRLVESKGGHILENRMKCYGFDIGDTFKFQCLEEMEVMFFFRDPIFSYFPFIFGANRKGDTLLISISCLGKIKEHEDKIIRKRRN